MTPEREAYNRELAAIERQTRAARKELNALILGAEEFDLVLTIELDPLWPPEMGQYNMVGAVRTTRARQQKLEELRLAADVADANRKLCDEGIHSWIAEPGRLAADAQCARCGEPYGNPE